MKGTAPRPAWPAAAERTCDVKPKNESSSRITLALLDDDSSAAKAKGYDPYNTTAAVAARRAHDVWRRKPKRD